MENVQSKFSIHYQIDIETLTLHQKEIESNLKDKLEDIFNHERRFNLSFRATGRCDYRWSDKTHSDIRKERIYDVRRRAFKPGLVIASFLKAPSFLSPGPW